MKRVVSLLRNELATGLLLMAPVLGTLWIVYWLVTSVDGLLPAAWRPRVFDVPLPGLGLVAVLVFALGLGLLAHNFAGRRLVQFVGHVVERVPLFGGTYGLLKQVIEAVFGSGSGSFKRAVLVEYPLRGAWAIGFVTQVRPTGAIASALGGEHHVSVFVPTCPNPTSGFFLVVAREHVRELDMSVDEAFKLVLTMGIADVDPEALVTTGRWRRDAIVKKDPSSSPSA